MRGRDAKGRIKKGFRLTRNGVRKIARKVTRKKSRRR